MRWFESIGPCLEVEMTERKPVEIDKASAMTLTRWMIQRIIDDKNTGFFRRGVLKAFIAPGGELDNIAKTMYDDMDVRLSLDANNTLHAGWLRI